MDGFHVIIVGAGAVGLLIAQGLKKEGISYSIHEQGLRGRDWGMALLWASTLLQDLLPRKILDRLQNAQVDPHLPAQPEETMYITDGASGNVIKAVLSPGARRVGKEALRKLLAEDLPVRFGHILKDIEETDTDVLAHFSDGTSERGDVIIGADGGKSTVRKILFGPRAEPVPLPYELANFNVSFEDSQALIIRQSLKPFVDRGIHEKGMFFLMCLQSVPDPSVPSTWTFQITITFDPKRVNQSMAHEDSSLGRLRVLKDLSTDWAEPRRSAMKWLSEETVVPKDRMAIWKPVRWEKMKGRVTLAGDAAHAMTFHRGQGLNNGVQDAHSFVLALRRAHRGEQSLKEAVLAYDKEMIARGAAEVDRSEIQTKADHDWKRLGLQSPIMQIGGNRVEVKPTKEN